MPDLGEYSINTEASCKFAVEVIHKRVVYKSYTDLYMYIVKLEEHVTSIKKFSKYDLDLLTATGGWRKIHDS